MTGVGNKKPHRVATVGFCLFKPQLACASVRLESVLHADTGFFVVAVVQSSAVNLLGVHDHVSRSTLAQVVLSANHAVCDFFGEG